MQTNGRKSGKKAKKIKDAAAVALVDDADKNGTVSTDEHCEGNLDVDEVAAEGRKKTRKYARKRHD